MQNSVQVLVLVQKNFISVPGASSVMCDCSCSLNFVSSLQAELVDVQYGTMEDLIRVQAITNVTKKIALLKLGQSPLLYKVSYTSAEWLFVWWVVFLWFFHFQNTKTKSFPFFPNKSGLTDIHILPQYSPLSLCSAFYVLELFILLLILQCPSTLLYFLWVY